MIIKLFFFNDPATTEIYTLSLHDALPICPPGRFAELARELSNCPSAAEGGELGWLGPEDCVDELCNEFFHQTDPLHGIGLRPRLVHSRHGFHIVEGMGRKQGRQLPFEEARGRLAGPPA